MPGLHVRAQTRPEPKGNNVPPIEKLCPANMLSPSSRYQRDRLKRPPVHQHHLAREGTEQLNCQGLGLPCSSNSYNKDTHRNGREGSHFITAKSDKSERSFPSTHSCKKRMLRFLQSWNIPQLIPAAFIARHALHWAAVSVFWHQ